MGWDGTGRDRRGSSCLVCPYRPAATSGLGAKTRPCAMRTDRSSAPTPGRPQTQSTQHTTQRDCVLSPALEKKRRLVYQHTAIEQRYGCTNRTRIDVYYLWVTTFRGGDRAGLVQHPCPCRSPSNCTKLYSRTTNTFLISNNRGLCVRLVCAFTHALSESFWLFLN